MVLILLRRMWANKHFVFIPEPFFFFFFAEMHQDAWRHHLNLLSGSLQRLTEQEDEGDRDDSSSTSLRWDRPAGAVCLLPPASWLPACWSICSLFQLSAEEGPISQIFESHQRSPGALHSSSSTHYKLLAWEKEMWGKQALEGRIWVRKVMQRNPRNKEEVARGREVILAWKREAEGETPNLDGVRETIGDADK